MEYSCDGSTLDVHFNSEAFFQTTTPENLRFYHPQPAEASLTTLENGDVELYISLTNTSDEECFIDANTIFLDADSNLLTLGHICELIPAGETIEDSMIIESDFEFLPAEVYIDAYH